MRIGLIDIEPKIFNTAYMQIAYRHKQQGDTVEWAAPLEYDRFDKLYCSSLFDFTDKSQVPGWAIVGGTGCDKPELPITELPFDCDLDYSIYPGCDRSFIWFSRGCGRDCPWCVVRHKEGDIRSVEAKNLNPNGVVVDVMDNNFFANPMWRPAMIQLMLWGQPVHFQGVDVTAERCLACCDCGLVHHQEYRIIEADDGTEHVIRRVIRDNRATAARRRSLKARKEGIFKE